MRYYCVARGLQNGIYFTWDECKEQVMKYKNSKYKKFDDLQDSKRYMEIYCENDNYYNYAYEIQNMKITNFFLKK
jgi:ribonuclease HI